MHEDLGLVGDPERLLAVGRHDLHRRRRHDLEAPAAGLGRRGGGRLDPRGGAARPRVGDRGLGPAVGQPERLDFFLFSGVGRIEIARRRDRLLECFFVGRHVAIDHREEFFLRGCLQLDRRRRPPRVAVHAGVGRRIEEGVERIKLLVRDRIELVAVADGALAGEAHPGVRHRGRAVDGVAEEQLVVDRAALARRDVAPREPGGDLLVGRGIRQQVAGELPDRELVERKILVEGLHDPVAVEPHLPFVVEMQPVGVGIAGVVEPVAGHLLAVVRAREQFLDELGIGVGRGVGDERGHLLGRWRQAGEGEG